MFITCAVTGAGDTTGRSERVPVTPEQIADSAIEAARAGAAIAHIHVRDPDTGGAPATPELYREVVERIRGADVDVVLNLTAGMGGDLVLGGAERPLPLDDSGTDMAGAAERLAHVEELLPGDLHARLRQHELRRRRRLRDGQHAGHAAGDGGAASRRWACGPSSRCSTPATSCCVKELIAEGLIDDPGDDPALHGHPLRRARTIPARCWRWSTSCRRVRSSRPSRSAACSCRTWRWRCWRAATSASGWRTTCTCRAACWRPTASWSSGRCAILEAMNVRVLGPGEVREQAQAARPWLSAAAPHTVGLLGGGVIGGGWAARFLLHGIDVRLYDPEPDAERQRGRDGRKRARGPTRG